MLTNSNANVSVLYIIVCTCKSQAQLRRNIRYVHNNWNVKYIESVTIQLLFKWTIKNGHK